MTSTPSNDLIYAATRDAVPDDSASLRNLLEASTEEERRQQRIPKLIMRLMLKSAAKRSLLVRAIYVTKATFLDGMTTYAMKLGADNLVPPYDSPMDRRAAASPHLVLLRLRTQQVAQLMADGLVAALTDAADRPLHLINIAGGPAIDSMNALNRRDRDLLRRKIVIHVLDPDEAGPYFGMNALAALKADGAPLAGLDIAFDHRTYDWDQPRLLAALVEELAASGAIVAASSEGGLFEYDSDAAIVANLQALRPVAKLVAGSVTSANEAHRRNITASQFKLIPRGIEGFTPLAERGGFKLARVETAQLSDQVLLVPA